MTLLETSFVITKTVTFNYVFDILVTSISCSVHSDKSKFFSYRPSSSSFGVFQTRL